MRAALVIAALALLGTASAQGQHGTGEIDSLTLGIALRGPWIICSYYINLDSMGTQSLTKTDHSTIGLAVLRAY